MSDTVILSNGEWREVSFEDMLVDKSISYGIVQPGSHTEENYVPIIRVQNIRNGIIDTSDIKKVASSIEDKYRRTRLAGGELLITVVGSIGECAIVPKSLQGWNVARAVSVARITEIFDINFVKYSFATEDLKFQMYGNTNDTVQPTLNLKELKSLKFLLPPLPEQKAIAEVLSSLDDKIDLLHRQNKTLEQMAETLFRQWFVVEAGEDWEEKPLSSIANFLNGLACQKFPPKNEVDKLPVLKIKQLRNGFSDDSDWCTTEVKPEYIISDGDVIFSWSASLMVKIWDGEKCILNQHLFKVSSDEFPKWFYYLWSKHHLDEFVSISSSHATTMGHIKRGDLDNAMVLVPSPVEIQKLSEVFTPLIDKIISNNKRLKNLVSLRDTLLPKLMSGEVRIASHG